MIDLRMTEIPVDCVQNFPLVGQAAPPWSPLPSSHRAAIPEALAGMPVAPPVKTKAPSDPIRHPAIVPAPGFKENRNRLFSLNAKSVGVDPVPVRALTPCESRSVKLPSRPKLNPVITPLPVSDVYVNLSFC